jgi:glycogen phosphorylase
LVIHFGSKVDSENFFHFGLSAEQFLERQTRGYRPRQIYEENRPLREVINFIASGALVEDDPSLFHPLVDNMPRRDPFLVLADYQAYVDCQDRVSVLCRDRQSWTQQSILTVARSGRFSTDRDSHEYCSQIWKVRPVPVEEREDQPDMEGGANQYRKRV